MNSSEEIENSLRLKLFEYVEQPHIHAQTTEAFYIWQDNPDTIKVYNDKDDLDDELISRFLDWFIFDFKTFDNNLRLIDLFVKESNDDLSIDERLVLKEWKYSTRSYFEIKDIKPGEFCILSELFSDKEIIVHDTIVSNNLNLTDVICARPLKTKERNYFFSLVSIFPLVFKPLILEYFNNNNKAYELEYGKQESHVNYLKDFGYLIGNHIDDVIKHPHYLTPEGENFVITKAEYRIINREEIIKYITNNESFSLLNSASDDLLIYRLNKLDDKELDVYIELEEKKLIVNCNSLITLDGVKFYLEKLLNKLIEHKKRHFKKF